MFIAGQVLKRSLSIFPDKVEGQEAVSAKKSALIYGALDAYPEAYKVVPDKSARSRMNICFRVIHVGNSNTCYQRNTDHSKGRKYGSCREDFFEASGGARIEGFGRSPKRWWDSCQQLQLYIIGGRSKVGDFH